MTVEQFGKALIASGLMTADDVKAIWNGLPADARPKTDADFGKLLVEKSLLTPFQVAEIIAGRGARLVMGDYTIVAQIGAGGMGQVYKAQHKRMKRTVALKVMSNAAMQDEAAVKRFQREVHAAAKLEHPNIVTAYDSGESGNVKYLVMQFVDGGDLSDLVKKGGRLPIEQAVGYVIQAARGLAFAHGEGVIHRDIKPANLLLDKKGVVKILDMGLARFEDGGDGLTATEQVMGTVDYMSPEQAANTKGCDGRADIYSLGCTLWYLLTGKKLYEGDTLIARLMAHRDGPLPSLVKERDDAPWPLEQALHKMIAKRAADRYQSMDEAIAALAPFGGASAGGTGGGSSPSMGQSAELASFMQAMGTGGGTKTNISATQVKPATSANVDATAQFTSPEVGTDPKSQVLPKAATTKPQTQTKKPKAGNNKTKMIAGGAVGMLLLLAGIIIKVLNKEGEVVAEIKVPDGGSVQVTSGSSDPASLSPKGDAPAASSATALTPAELLTSFHHSWTTPESVGPSVNGPGDQDLVSLTNDQLRLFFHRKGGPDGKSDELWEAVRTSPTLPFGAPRFLTTTTAESFVSSDGLSLVTGTSGLSSKRRKTIDSPFEPVDFVSQVRSSTVDKSPTLSLDGLTLVFNSQRDMSTEKTNLYISRRRTTADAFGPPVKLGPAVNTENYEHRGLLLGDGKTFVFVRDDWFVTKTNPDGSTIAVPLYGHPFVQTRNAWFTSDGSTAYFSADLPGGAGGQDIYVTHRKPLGGAASSTTANVASAPPSFIPSTISQTPAPPGDYALLLDRNSSVTAPNPQLDESQPFTVEAYITPGDAAAIDLVNQRILGVHGEFHFTLIDGRWRFYSTHDEATSPEKFTPRQRIHIAGVRTATQRLLFIDGKRVAATDEPLGLKKKDDDFPLHIQPMGPVVVTVDEVRVSQGVVYDKPFTPPAKLTADANTVALYHFDEGFGDVLKDSSGKGRDGKIIGATWVKADGSPIPTPGIPSSTTLTPASPTMPIPAEALAFAGHRYLLVDHFCTWSEAKAKAEALGGHLATVNGKEERDWILTNIVRNRPRADESDRVRQVRLGGYIAGPGDRWSWITGEPFDESLWLGSMPTVVERCGLCWTADGTWNNSPTDSPNARSFFFLVEWDTLGAPVSQAGPPAADYALQFDGKSAHVVTPLVHQPNEPLTIEATLQPGAFRGAVVSDSEGRGIGLDVVDDVPNFLVYRRSGGKESYARISGTRKLENDRPHRLAAVFDGAKLRLFVDGELQQTGDLAGEYLPSGLPFMIGASPDDVGIDYPFAGTIDEVRFSKSARYTANYTPPSRLEADADTIALYHFDEGSGEVLKDASVHHRDAKLVGAKWVKLATSTAPLGAVPAAARPHGPLTPTKPEELAWLKSLGARLNLRNGEPVDRVVTKNLPLPDGSWTVVGIELDRDGGTAIDDAAFGRICALVDLESFACDFGMPGARVTKQGFDQLKKLTNLRRLQIGRLSPSASDPAVLAEMPHLESLGLMNSPLVGWEPYAAKLPNLNELKLYNTDEANLKQLGVKPRLTKLRFAGYHNHHPIRQTAAQPFMAANPWCQVTFVGLDGDNMKQLVIEPTASPSNAAPAATTSVANGPKPVDYALERKVAEWLLGLDIKLRIDSGGSVREMKPGDTLPDGPFTVERIATQGSRSAALAATASGLDDLRRLSNFKGGYLHRDGADAWAEAFAAIPSVTQANAFECDLTDAGLARLSSLPNLEYVNLDNCTRITSAGLNALSTCGSLRFLMIDTTLVESGKTTVADLQKLQDAIPLCAITFPSGAPIPGLKRTSTSMISPGSAADDPATVAKWLLDDKKLAKIGFEIDGKRVGLSTLPASPYRIVDLNFNKSNNAGRPLTEAEVARLAVFTDLESLELFAPELNDAGFARLAPLTKLKVLVVSSTSLTPASVATLRQFPQLEKLQAFGGDDWLRSLAGMPTIRSLIFYRTSISAGAMSWFSQYPNLTELDFHDCRERNDDSKSLLAVAPLKDCQRLSKLTIGGFSFTASQLGPLAGLKQLRELVIKAPAANELTEAQAKTLAAALPSCRITYNDAANNRVTIEPTVTPPTASSTAAPATGIEQWIKETSIKPAAEQLEAVSKKLIDLNPGFDGMLTGTRTGSPPTIENGVVTSLRVNGSTITDLAPLRALTGLVELDFGGPSAAKGKFTDLSSLRGMQLKSLILSGMGAEITDLTPLAGMPLEYLSCRELRKLTDLGPIAGMSKLKHLDFLYTGVADLAKVQGLQALEVLILPKSITDISPLKSLKLEHLQCNQITSLEPLRGMPLKTLWFSSESLTDFSPLYELKDLEHVRIINAKLPEGFQASLQKALPNCRIDLK